MAAAATSSGADGSSRLASSIAATALLALVGGSLAFERWGPLAAALPDPVALIAALPPPPRPGDARDRADRATFVRTRSLEGGARWRLAVRDVRLSTAALMEDFGCATGVAMTPSNAPLTARLIRRTGDEAALMTNLAKRWFRRDRPFLVDPGRICEPLADVESYDYPSGHATRGWMAAAVLGRLVPARAAAIDRRAQVFADSRVVCGSHSLSAVRAARASADLTFSAVVADPRFEADARAAAAELARLAKLAPRCPIPAASPPPGG